MKLNADQVNYLNIALMLLSAGLAYLFPFELFLFAYAVMGPLHYLTEISWLHNKNYYTRGKYDYLFLAGASLLVSLIFFGWLPSAPKGTAEFLTCTAFLGALALALVKGPLLRFAALLAAGLVAFLFSAAPAYHAVFGLFLPTLIHVFLFTAAFILVGALRGRNFPGLLSLAVFAGLSLSFLFLHPAHGGYPVGGYVRDNYGYLKDDGTGSSPFVSLNYYIVKNSGLHDFGQPTGPLADYVKTINDFLYQNPLALSLMAFIAFAYTYHYFNWFSKTSVIGWHAVSRRRTAVILGLWGLSLALYAYDYSLGLRWLFFLSFTHVLLEFPLNQLTWIGIGRETWKLFSSPGWKAGKVER